MPIIGIIVGSTRPGRLGPQIGEWVYQQAVGRSDAEYVLLDLADFALPLLDEPIAAMAAPGTQPHTTRWAAAIEPLDGILFVTAEYNHGVPAALKNAIDFLYAEWNRKPVGFVRYGVDGAVRAVEHLRGVMAQVRAATIGPQVVLTLDDDFHNYHTFTPRPFQHEVLSGVLTELVSWATVLRGLRVGESVSLASTEA